MKKENCYYVDYSVCTCTMSTHCDKSCVGAEACDNYISESDYFGKMMAGEVKDSAPTEDRQARQQRINKNLSLGKTKKQVKYEAKQQAEKERARDEARGLGNGYSLMDDPRFKGLFGDKK